MSRRILFQVVAPPVVVGLLLLAACVAGVWYTSRIQRDLGRLLSQNVAGLIAAQELEIKVRQLRFHSFLYLAEPTPARKEPIAADERGFQDALAAARSAADSADERRCLADIEVGFRRYQSEMAQLQAKADRGEKPPTLGQLADAHPLRYVVDPCHELLRIGRAQMTATSQEVQRAGDQARLALALLAVVGPAAGVFMGYGIARGLSRSIYRLSLRVQDMAQHLDQDVGSLTVAADGDIQSLDRQLAHVVSRVEEVGERLQRHQRDVLRAEQLAAVGRLAAGVAHEVRNPLTSVKLLVESALADPNGGLSADDLRVIHAEIERLEQTVQSLLDFARPPSLHRAPCDLRGVVGQAADLVRARARNQGVELRVESPVEPVTADVDRGQLGSVLLNLLMNALDAMPRGGTLAVRLSPEPDAARIDVEDTGPGLPAALAGRLFMPFASTKSTGTGLGLSICRRVVEDHQGSITAADRTEGGARFTVRLPFAMKSRARSASKGSF